MADSDLHEVLPGVVVKPCISVPEVAQPLFSGLGCRVSQNEFALHVEEVGRFFVRNGSEVIYNVADGADPGWVRLYLNARVLVALLHQRKIINFHASSFIYSDRGLMILGETGAGKSSLTVSFALAGAGFLTDDLTALDFSGTAPSIWPLNRDVKLREDMITNLGVSRHKLRRAETGTGKQYLDIGRADVMNHSLDLILKIEVGECSEVEFNEPLPAVKFSMLRSEICSWEILAGMPETEAAYLQQLVTLVEKVPFVRVVRPENIKIADLHQAVESYIKGMSA